MFKVIIRPSQLSPLKISNFIKDEDSVVIKGDTFLNTVTNIKVRTTTTKINTPDKYYGDRRKLKTFII